MKGKLPRYSTRYLVGVIAVVMAGCASVEQQTTPAPTQAQTQTENLSPTDVFERLVAGRNLVTAGSPKKAIDDYFDPVIAQCDKQFSDGNTIYYIARSPEESLYYLVIAAAEKKDATVIEIPCADAHFLKAYASVDLGRIDDAKTQLLRAIDYSPVNSAYHSELAHIYTIEKRWEDALAGFTQARKYAETFSPEEAKQFELSRAMRGIGYTLIELERLDEAEDMFNECLKIDPNDDKARNELRYIEQVRANHGRSL